MSPTFAAGASGQAWLRRRRLRYSNAPAALTVRRRIDAAKTKDSLRIIGFPTCTAGATCPGRPPPKGRIRVCITYAAFGGTRHAGSDWPPQHAGLWLPSPHLVRHFLLTWIAGFFWMAG